MSNSLIGFEITKTGLAHISPRTWARVKRRAYRAVAELWYDKIRPKKYTHEGSREYAFTPRSGEESGTSGRAFWRSYTGRKLRKWGHTRPNIWTGRAELETRRRRFTARHTGVRIRVFARVFNLYPNVRTQINIRGEMRQLSQRDLKLCREEAGKTALRELPRRHRKRTTIRIGAF